MELGPWSITAFYPLNADLWPMSTSLSLLPCRTLCLLPSSPLGAARGNSNRQSAITVGTVYASHAQPWQSADIVRLPQQRDGTWHSASA
jgi:hypothetical protein